MLNGGWNLDSRQVKEMRDYHKQQLSLGWLSVSDGNFRTRYKIIEKRDDYEAYEIESFYTVVCYITKEQGLWYILKEWDGWSSTTQRGINQILKKIGAPLSINKKLWNDLPYLQWAMISGLGK